MPEKDMQICEMEKKWQGYWKKEEIYRFREDAEGFVYSIDTPPPTVSGNMHMGHAFSYTHQDFIARHRRMKGFNVFYPFGLDDNGLATERLVEKNRNITSKKFTREEFIKICFEETASVEQHMIGQFGLLGTSIDWSLVYRTIDSPCRKTAQKSFLEIYAMGRAYAKEAPVMWCPKCETAIAQAELEDQMMESTFNDIYFSLENNEKIIIATTRPEMLSACVAVFVHPEDKKNSRIVGKKALVPLYNYSVPIIADERVNPEKGTGIVMCCTFGDQTDIEWFLAHNLPIKTAIGLNGRMTAISGKYEGKSIRDARKEIIADLATAGLLVKQNKISHAVNVHERCKTEIEFMSTRQWFIKYLDLKEEFIKKGRELNWHPEHMRHRYENWINGLQWDWCISRQRFFGVPFPLWYCKKCSEPMLAQEKDLPVDPLQDKPKGKCAKCDCTEFYPEKDVFDTWFTSSLTPQINAKWADSEKKEFTKKIFPMSLRPQAHDIICLWAFNTIVKAYFHNNTLPWKDIMVSGHALDSKGRKMSKSLGNAIDPEEIIEKYSADILRYWAASASLGEDLPFQEKEFVTGRKFVVKMLNAAKFVEGATAEFKETKGKKRDYRAPDLWLLSRLNRTIKESDESLENYEFAKALSKIRNFFWLEFADYYLEEVKHRIYGKNEESKEAAQEVLLATMTGLIKMIAPFLPHTAEELYLGTFGKIAKEKSVHLEKWPTVDEKLISEEAEKKGELLNSIIAAIRKHKSSKSLSLNSPLKKIIVVSKEKETRETIASFEDEIKGIMLIGEIGYSDRETALAEKIALDDKTVIEIRN